MKAASKFTILLIMLFLSAPLFPTFAEGRQPAGHPIEHYGPDSDIARQQTAALRTAQFDLPSADYGEEIVFVLNDGIYVQFANGTGRRRLIQRGTGYSSFAYPAWSLDGTKIAFSAVYTDPRYVDLIVCGADGSSPTVIATLYAGYYNSYMNSISWHWGNEYIMFSYWYNDYELNTVAVICTVRYDGADFVIGPGSDRFYCQYEPVLNSVRYAYIANGSPLSMNSDLRVSNLNGTNDVLWWRRAGVINGFTHVCWNNANSIYTVVKNWSLYPGKEVLVRVDKVSQTYTVIMISDPAASLWSPTASPDRMQLYCSESTSQTSTLYQLVLGANGLPVSLTPRGVGFYPNWRQSTSSPVLPTVTTTTVTNIAQTSAQSGGNVTSQGSSAVSARGVCWSTAANPTIANSKTVNGSGTGSYVSSLTGLNSNTTYHVRAYATNSAGTAYGNDIAFTTLAAPTLPTVTTTAVTNITQTSAESGGNVSSQGSSAVTARGVCWSTAANPTIANSKTVNGSGTGSYVSSLTGLSPNTTYHVRAYATNSAGTAYGNDIAFTTLAAPTLPTVTTTAVTNILGTSAQSGGNVTSQGGASVTARGVCWGTTSNPKTTGNKTIDGSGTGVFVSSITGLLPGTTYHVRAYATNAFGTAYGTDLAFTTNAKIGIGQFQHSGSWTGAGHGEDGWYVGDFNGDRRDDIFRYVAGVSGAQVFLSDGTKFILSGSWTDYGHGTDGWYVGDFNGDGRDDIFRYVAGVSGAQVLLSDGTKFVYSGSWTGAGHGTDGWYVGDFNGDDRDDIFRYMPGLSGAQVFLSDGTKFVYSGSWTGAGHGTDGWYIGDYNGDGRDDIFRYMPGVSGAQVFLSDGAKFVLSGSWTELGHGTDGWYVGDFSGDGKDDIFRYVAGVSGAQVLLSNGTKFVYSGSWTGAGHSTDGWYVGDFNGDYWADIFRYMPGVSGADVFLCTWTAGSTATNIESLSASEIDTDMVLDLYGARQTELSYPEEAALLAPFMTRMMMGEEVSIYEIKTAYEQRVERVVRLVEIRQVLQRHGYWDIEGQVCRVKQGTDKIDNTK